MSTGQQLAWWEGTPVEDWREQWRLPALTIYDRVSSTNDLARAAALQGAAAGTVVIADYQSSGRGRLGRSWLAPPGTSLLFSMLLRPGEPGVPEAAGALPLRIGVVLVEVLGPYPGIGIKWPNDVVIADRKVAGILCEAGAGFVIVGIGLNVGQSAADFPPELTGQATSLRLVAGEPPARAALAGALLERLRPLATRPHGPLEAGELERFRALDTLAGRPILLDGEPAGNAAGIDPNGTLLVDGPDGRVACYAGTVRTT